MIALSARQIIFLKGHLTTVHFWPKFLSDFHNVLLNLDLLNLDNSFIELIFFKKDAVLILWDTQIIDSYYFEFVQVAKEEIQNKELNLEHLKRVKTSTLL